MAARALTQAQQAITRSYRCHYNPLDGFGNPILSESGLLPFVQVKAATAEHAMRAALATIRGAVSHVERIEDAAPATPGARQ
jgi:hypothetical protein